MPNDMIEVGGGVPMVAWTHGVEFEDTAKRQVENIARLPFIFRHVAVMPDVPAGVGATVGTVIATKGAVIPAAVGVDIGCGVVACSLDIRDTDLPDSLTKMRTLIEEAVPHGGPGPSGGWQGKTPRNVQDSWAELAPQLEKITERTKVAGVDRAESQLGSLGGGNHFVEVCLDENGAVWLMLHSGSRGIGNAIGTKFIELAREDMRRHFINLPDRDLAYLPEGTENFGRYIEAVEWAQWYAMVNRELMLEAAVSAVGKSLGKRLKVLDGAVNCHHNYVSRETHFGHDVIVTRKGAVRAGLGDLGVIPGSMGAKSYIVRGRGNRDSFCSCSHGAGRRMSRGEAKRTFTLADHRAATSGVECRKDKDVIDETPGAYKNIDDVMTAQSDLVEVVHTLKQVVCVKG